MRITPQIRRAVVADVEMLAQLSARTFHDSFAEMNTPQNMSAYISEAFTVSRLTSEINDPQNLFLIAEVDGTPAGYAKLHAGSPPGSVIGPRPIELARLYVDREFLGTGVGNDLMEACIDEARNLGHRTLYLGVWEHNHRAQSFYFRWKFRVVGNQIFRLGDDLQLDWLMEREL